MLCIDIADRDRLRCILGNDRNQAWRSDLAVIRDGLVRSQLKQHWLLRSRFRFKPNWVRSQAFARERFSLFCGFH